MDVKSTSVRAASGSVYVLLIILACLVGEIGIACLASLFSALGIVEFRKMRFGNPGNHLFLSVYNAIGGILLTLSFLIYPIFFWILWAIGRMLITIYSHDEHPEKEYAVDMAAQIYIAVPMALLCTLAFFCEDMFATCLPILSIFILIWVNDTGAFIFGSLLGKHRLFERISPKKSWEGFWGGCFCTVLTGILLGATSSSLSEAYLGNKIEFWAVVGLLISISATYGDLFESAIKRQLHLKDSGNLIPGHGGILDRIDSLLLVIPAVVVFLAFYVLILTHIFPIFS